MRRALTIVVCAALLCALGSAASAASAEAAASWSISQSEYEFAPRAIGTGPSAAAVFTLTNTGTTTLHAPAFTTGSYLSESEPEDHFALTSHCGAGLAPGGSCPLEVTFEPTGIGHDIQFIGIGDAEGQVGTLSLRVSGSAALPAIQFIPSGVFLPSRLLGIEINPPSVLVVTNPGETDLHLYGIGLVELGTNPVNPDGFRIVGGSCGPGVTLAVGGSCTVQLTATPTVAGTIKAGLEFTDDVPGRTLPGEKISPVGHQIMPLRAVGVAATEPPVAADVDIFAHPPASSRRTWARFRFAVPEARPTFLCRLDAGPYRPCASPTTYRHLAPGRHVFRVRPSATSATVSGRPAVDRFRVLPPPRRPHLTHAARAARSDRRGSRHAELPLNDGVVGFP